MTDNGFHCPECGGQTRVLDTRHHDAGERESIRRRRQCRQCPCRFTTLETIAMPGRGKAVSTRDGVLESAVERALDELRAALRAVRGG